MVGWINKFEAFLRETRSIRFCLTFFTRARRYRSAYLPGTTVRRSRLLFAFYLQRQVARVLLFWKPIIEKRSIDRPDWRVSCQEKERACDNDSTAGSLPVFRSRSLLLFRDNDGVDALDEKQGTSLLTFDDSLLDLLYLRSVFRGRLKSIR